MLEGYSLNEKDPMFGMSQFRLWIRRLKLSGESVVTVDITGFSTKNTLLLLKNLDELGLWDCLRVIYSEPDDYRTDYLSTGIKEIEVVPGFVNLQSLAKPLLLLIFLGYEGDRAAALVQNIYPNETMLAIPRPPYKQGWDLGPEELNRNLIRIIGDDRKIDLHSLVPEMVMQTLSNVLNDGVKAALNRKKYALFLWAPSLRLWVCTCFGEGTTVDSRFNLPLRSYQAILQ